MSKSILIFILLAATLRPVNGQDGAPAASDSTAPPVRLLEDIPNYAEALVRQWSSGLGAAAEASDWTSYGRLREIGEPQPLTLSDAVVLAVRHNTGLQVERLAPLTARAGVLDATSAFDPVIFGEVNKTRSVRPADSQFFATEVLDQNFNANVGVRKLFRSGALGELFWTNRRNRSSFRFQALDPDYTTELLFSLNQPLLRNFGLRYTTILIRLAQTAELQAIRNYEAQIAATVLQVERAYWDLVGAIQNVRVQEQGLAASRELLRQNQGKFDVGAVPRTAVLEAQADVARREAELIRVERAVATLRDSLRALVNAPQEEADAVILIDPTEQPEIQPYPLDVDASLRRAREERPELAAAELQVRVAGLNLKAAENQLLPRLDAVGSIGLNGLSGDQVPLPTPGQEPIEVAPSAFAGGYRDALELMFDGRFYSYLAGVVLEIPIANAAARADYATAKIDLERARLGFHQVQQLVTLEIKTSINNLQSDLKSIEATRIARELAAENLQNQQARYDVGLATTKDLLDFQDQLTQAQAAEVQALTRYAIDLAELRRAEGTLLEARNVVLDVAPEDTVPWWARF